MRRTFFCRRPPVIPSGCLRPPGASFRHLTIGGLRRDLSAEIIKIKPGSRPAMTGEKSTVVPIPQHLPDHGEAADYGFFCEVMFHRSASIGV